MSVKYLAHSGYACTIYRTATCPQSNSRTGYGRKLPTRYMVYCHATGRKYRVYAICYSNAASPYITVKGEQLFLRDADVPTSDLPVELLPPARMTYRDALAELKIDLPSDPWGNAMGLFFDVAAQLYILGGPHMVPPAWRYRPGAGGPVVEDETSIVLQMDVADLLQLGEILHRYTCRLDRAGKSY